MKSLTLGWGNKGLDEALHVENTSEPERTPPTASSKRQCAAVVLRTTQQHAGLGRSDPRARGVIAAKKRRPSSSSGATLKQIKADRLPLAANAVEVGKLTKRVHESGLDGVAKLHSHQRDSPANILVYHLLIELNLLRVPTLFQQQLAPGLCS